MSLRRNKVKITISGTEVTASAINTAITTDWIDCDGADTLTLGVQYTYGAGTLVQVTFQASNDKSAAYSVPTYSDSSGTVTASASQVQFDPSGADADFVVTINNPPLRYLRAQIVATGSPTTSDVVALEGWMTKEA